MNPLNEATLQSNSIEQIFCIPFSTKNQQPMSDDISKIMIQLMLMPKDVKLIPQDNTKPFLVELIEKRVKHCFDYTIIDERLLLFIAILAETPGTAVMYLTYLQYWCMKNNTKELTLDIFCEIFPWGFLSNNDLSELWKNQKINSKGSDNLLDYAIALQSIRF